MMSTEKLKAFASKSWEEARELLRGYTTYSFVTEDIWDDFRTQVNAAPDQINEYFEPVQADVPRFIQSHSIEKSSPTTWREFAGDRMDEIKKKIKRDRLESVMPPPIPGAIQIPIAKTERVGSEGDKRERAIGENFAGRPFEVWPTVAIGDEIEIRNDGNGYMVHGVVTEIRDYREAWVDKVLTKIKVDRPYIYFEVKARTPRPLPPVDPDEKVYSLPNLSGHGWTRSWMKGTTVRIHGEYYRVRSVKVKDGCHYTLAPATEVQYAKRTGRTMLKKDRSEVQNQVGRAVQIDDEWLHIKKITNTKYGSGEGDEVFGRIYWGEGNFVTEAQAKRLNAKWQLHADVRRLELDLKVATGYESMADSAEIEKIKAKLEVAKAKIK